MAKRRHKAGQIIAELREAEVELAKGQPISKVVRKLGITEQTYYRWRKEYGGPRVRQRLLLCRRECSIACPERGKLRLPLLWVSGRFIS